jgi:hypothetical protein
MWRIEFSSAKFLPYLPEACQANPGVYGFELAGWLSRALMTLGFVTTYPLGEDWGWLIEYVDGELEFMIGCSSVCMEDEGYTGKSIDWSIFVDLRKSLKQKVLGAATNDAQTKITQAIVAALAAESIEVRNVEA